MVETIKVGRGIKRCMFIYLVPKDHHFRSLYYAHTCHYFSHKGEHSSVTLQTFNALVYFDEYVSNGSLAMWTRCVCDSEWNATMCDEGIRSMTSCGVFC